MSLKIGGVTRTDLTKALTKTKRELQANIEGVRQELRRDISKFNKDISIKILESEERLMKELKDTRENSDAHQFSHMRINDDLQELDTRVRKLEQPQI